MKNVKHKEEYVDWHTIKPGDLVQLKWNGYPSVPKWLHLSWADVIRFTKAGGLVIQASLEETGYTRTIRPGNVCAHVPTIKNKPVD